MAETSAASRAFSIPELFNEILSYLPQSCLLVKVPLVCKSWAMALTSPGIERALWFRPAIHNGPTTWSSLLEEKFGIFFDFTYLLNGHVLCPGAFAALPWKRNHNAFKRADASWRDMLVFQPPCYALKIERIKHERGGLQYETATISCPDGLRMGMVWDIAQEWCLRRKHWLQMTGPEVEKIYRNPEVGYTERMIPKMILHWHITCPRRASLASLEDDWVSMGREEKVETFETIIGISNDQAQSNKPLEKENTTKAANTVEEKALAAARKIKSISFYNKPHIDASDTIAHEHRFWTTYYILVSDMPFIDEYDALGAFYKSLGNQKLNTAAGKSKYASSALNSLPRNNRGPNPAPVDFEFFKICAMLILEELSSRIWAPVHSKWSRIQIYWLKIQHGANEKWAQEWHDISILAQNLTNNLKSRLHSIDAISLGRIILNAPRTDLESCSRATIFSSRCRRSWGNGFCIYV